MGQSVGTLEASSAGVPIPSRASDGAIVLKKVKPKFMPIFDVDPKDIKGKPRKLTMRWSLFNTVDIKRNLKICRKCKNKPFCDVMSIPPNAVAEDCKFTAEHAVSQKRKKE